MDRTELTTENGRGQGKKGRADRRREGSKNKTKTGCLTLLQEAKCLDVSGVRACFENPDDYWRASWQRWHDAHKSQPLAYGKRRCMFVGACPGLPTFHCSENQGHKVISARCLWRASQQSGKSKSNQTFLFRLQSRRSNSNRIYTIA